MKGFTIALVSLLMACDITIARPSLHASDNYNQLEVRKIRRDDAASLADHTVLLDRRQGGGRGGGGGGRGGCGGGGGNANAGNNAAKGNNGGNNRGNNGNNNGAAAAASASAAAAAAQASAAAAGNNAANNGNNNNNNNNGNNNAAAVAINENGQAGPAVPKLQENTGGTTLDKSVLVSTKANANATAGQAASAVSGNNFINFCKGNTITNGLQVKEGSCNPIVMGQIPSTQNMVTTTFSQPKNGATIKAGQTFTMALKSSGITMGSFTNAQANYYAAPQQVDQSGQVVGHAHVVIQAMKSMDDDSLLDPNTFAFFKGLDKTDVNGLSTLDISGGLQAGAYRMCTIMSSSNHASVIMPIAQRGAENTCTYFQAA
ncbi:hypothetical protein L198_02827 [Cryptococcus wingfieldii CBS 7118]|uniref:Ribosomal protein s17 n=1 Tax=Cryptococcus wingfieldii CBS 7118 TaxID=1295528 RepID=A0A1E3JN65_9TREE|nr:hypothetical protein L198_02827 [Cryptococcus wingfieldii CBS 7118]ODO02096.1 hypothetical protein L198_02827 [Cryptococcus wingfieldii CBS 7118]